MDTRKLVYKIILIKMALILLLYSNFAVNIAQAQEPTTLRYAELTDVTQLDPLAYRMDNTSLRFSTLLFSRLVGSSSDLRLQPELLESLTPESYDNDSYRFRLRGSKGISGQRDSVKWVCCNSRREIIVVKDFTAVDVVYTFNRIKNENTFYDDVKRIIADARPVAGDDHLVEFVLNTSNPLIGNTTDDVKLGEIQKALRIPVVPDLSGLDPKCVTIRGERKLVSNGPFVAQRDDGRDIVLVRNPYYFKAPLPIPVAGGLQIEEIVMQYYRDSKSAKEDLLARRVDMIVELPYKYISEVKSAGNFKLDVHGTNNFSFFAYNCGDPFSDYRIRQAFTHAIDRQAMFIGLYGEIYPEHQDKPLKEIKEILHSPLPSNESPSDIIPLEYDPERARRLKSESGFSADRITLLTYIGEEDDDRISQDFKQYIRDNLGIDVKLQSVTNPEWNRRFLNGEFECAYGKWAFYEDSPIIKILFSRGSNKNAVSYQNQDIEKLIRDYELSDSPEIRLEIKHEMARILAKEVPYTFLFQLPKYVAYRANKLQGVVLHPYEFFNYIQQWYIFEP